MTATVLRGMTWSHPRGYDPLVACSALWKAKTGVEVSWDKRSLQDFESFPVEELGLAMGTNTMVAAVGLVIGPVLGGALVTIGWSWVFWFNVPLGVLGCL